MSINYTRAHVDRASLDGKGPIRFIAASEGKMADGIDLRMAGAQLERFRANPIVGFGHSYHGRTNLPVGRAVRVEVEGNRLFIDVEFDRSDPFAAELERKYRDGFMNAVSIGFGVTGWEAPNQNMWDGGVATQWELFELSAVPVPMDATAVAVSRSAERETLREIVAEIVRDLMTQPLGEPGTTTSSATTDTVWTLGRTVDGEFVPDDKPLETAPAGLDPDSAADLLAAFDALGGQR